MLYPQDGDVVFVDEIRGAVTGVVHLGRDHNLLYLWQRRHVLRYVEQAGHYGRSAHINFIPIVVIIL